MELAQRLASIDARIASAARAAGRDPASITRIVVTKFHPAALVRELHALGVRDIGENRQQELTAKITEVGDLPGMRWHFVGQAQTNKARALARVHTTVPLTVHTIDRVRLATALDRALTEETADPVDVLLQVNLTDDPARGGAAPAEVEALAESIAGCASLRLQGVMAVAPLDAPAAEAFERLATLAQRVRGIRPDATWISAGMSGDFEEAIAAGATHLRIGSAITGNRPPHG